jgi:hypothetical protein
VVIVVGERDIRAVKIIELDAEAVAAVAGVIDNVEVVQGTIGGGMGCRRYGQYGQKYDEWFHGRLGLW